MGVQYNWGNLFESISPPEEQERIRKLWREEHFGGLTEDNKPLPIGIVWLLFITVITAFMVSFPLWGLRPTGADVDMIVSTAADQKTAMSEIGDLLNTQDMNRVQLVMHKVAQAKQAGVNLETHWVIGNNLVETTYQDASKTSPWWDAGFTLDIFWIIAFCSVVLVTVKALPPFTYEPMCEDSH